jgi:hypothetical protein
MRDDKIRHDKRRHDVEVSETHLRYAKWLARGTAVGFVVMALGFVVYVAGVIEPHVALEDLPSLWSQPASSYLAATGIPGGWGWARLLHKSDMLNLIGVALLSGCSIAALIAVIPLYARQRERLIVAVCALEVLIIALAASNVFATAH